MIDIFAIIYEPQKRILLSPLAWDLYLIFKCQLRFEIYKLSTYNFILYMNMYSIIAYSPYTNVQFKWHTYSIKFIVKYDNLQTKTGWYMTYT